jgi:acyl transferase domain-containing protein/acyl carrier protein
MLSINQFVSEADSSSDADHLVSVQSPYGDQDIAIVGMACRFPGANNYDEFWTNLISSKNSVIEIPNDRWDWSKYYGDPAAGGNKTNSKWGGFLKNVDAFDASFFGISPREAVCMDPQQRIGLELAWQCIEDAGYIPKELSGKNIGVFIGASNTEYKTLRERFGPSLEGHHSTGLATSIIPNRISYFFDFHGPSIAVDTACSSSLVAMQAAINSIRAGECEAAIVGGISIMAVPDTYLAFGKVGMLSATGGCHTFDERADGYVRGEGGGLIYMKPLSKAKSDGDRVLGVIKGIAVNHGGRTRSLTAPSMRSQSKVIVAALRQAAVSPSTVNYVEAHGTGTPLGDPIEIHGLLRAFSQSISGGEELASGYCALGAVKANIGHLESAAGIASVIKVLLAMKFKTIPGNINYSKLNPRISLQNTPFYIADKQEEWKNLFAEDGSQIPLRAGISCFGFGGVNSHVILEQSPVATDAAKPDFSQHQILNISAKSEKSLIQLMQSYVNILARPESDLASVCQCANVTRTAHDFRISKIGVSREELISELQAEIAIRVKANATERPPATAKKAAPVIGFMFTGQGSQYVGMGRDLFDSHAVFREAFELCDRLLKPVLGVSIIEISFSNSKGDLNQTRFTQPALFAFEYALVQMWKSHGISATAVIGHSVGEIVAACVAGIFTLEDALTLVVARAQLMDALPPTGGMATIHENELTVRQWIEHFDSKVDIAAINSPHSTTISGLMCDVDEMLSYAEKKGAQTGKLNTVHGFHSRLMDSVLEPFKHAIQNIAMSQPNIHFFSNVSGGVATDGQVNQNYWVDHVRRPVLFRAGIEQMHKSGVNVFLEIGPASVLAGLGRRSCEGALHWISSLQREGLGFRHVLSAMGELFRLGADVDFRSLYDAKAHASVELPVYPFSGESYWVESEPVKRQGIEFGHILSPELEPLLGNRVRLANANEYIYIASYPNPALEYLEGHRVNGSVVMPASGYIAMAFAALSQSGIDQIDRVAFGITSLKLHNLLYLQPGVLMQTILQKSTDADSLHRFEVWSCEQMNQDQSNHSKADSTAEAAWILVASGQVGPRSYSTVGTSFAALAIEREEQTLDVDEMYADMALRGLEYGPTFRVVRSIVLREDTVDAQLILHSAVDSTSSSVAHASLIDAVFQVAYPLLAEYVTDSKQVFVPASIDSIAISQRVNGMCYVKARVVSGTNSRGSLHCDFQLFSEGGTSIGEVKGLNLRLLMTASRGATDQKTLGRSNDWLYQINWKKQPDTDLRKFDVIDGQSDTILLYSSESRALAEHMAVQLTKYKRPICLDADPRRPSDPPAPEKYYSIDLDLPSMLLDILATFAGVKTIYFFGGFCISAYSRFENIGNRSPALVETAKKYGEFSLFNLLKCIAQLKLTEHQLVLKVITNYSYAVTPGQKVIPWGAGTLGLATVFCRENPTVELVNIDLDLVSDDVLSGQKLARTADRIINENSATGGRTCAYRGAEQYMLEIEPIPPVPSDESGFKWRGVYIILGGAGGIGLRFSQYLAEKYSAQMVLIGRSELNDQQKLEIAAIELAGGSVLYVQENGADLDAMSKVVALAKQRFGHINGAIHSALVLRDSLLSNMDVDAFSEALIPKMDASWNLYQALSGEPLDFLMFFSSAVSLSPTIGQGNYVAGCAFQDSFAAYLRTRCAFPVKVVNWGRWGEVGVATVAKYSQHFDAHGVYPIDPVEGVEAIETVLCSPAQQVLAIKADPARIAAFGVSEKYLKQHQFLDESSTPQNGAGKAAMKLSASDIDSLAMRGDQAILQSTLFTYLLEELTDVLRIAPGSFDPKQNDLRDSYLSELGMDSLTAVDLRNRLRKQLSVDIPIEVLLGGVKIQAVFDKIYEEILVRRLMNISQESGSDCNDDDGEVENMDTLVI